MAQISNFDQSLKQMLPSSSLLASAGSIPGPATTSANGGRPSKSREMPREYPQRAYKAQQSHEQASSSYQAPMLQRWLNEGNSKKDAQFRDRGDYPKGAAGMSQHLNDWDRAWQRADNQANGKDLGKNLAKDLKERVGEP